MNYIHNCKHERTITTEKITFIFTSVIQLIYEWRHFFVVAVFISWNLWLNNFPAVRTFDWSERKMNGSQKWFTRTHNWNWKQENVDWNGNNNENLLFLSPFLLLQLCRIFLLSVTLTLWFWVLSLVVIYCDFFMQILSIVRNVITFFFVEEFDINENWIESEWFNIIWSM